ncbi:unnamed protein product [Vitrella brassicaformis CCMP3155]|uniref:Uncharacterized protein n=1 Tax=Vitrella brassicaformis (strain CCMP3155) TaxID=1169540 RepID=A0A0G4FXU0_VITBC|nr:unnamed protein product [Vitrella brassicaformis CCMP3155]|eukprot:CEM20143.1 unnamed protein product [Vitrella brassicaformis CCMP3155]
MGSLVTVSSSRQAVPPARGEEQIDFIHSLGRDAIHTLKDIGILRCTATFLSHIDFSAAVLRSRLGRCLAAKQLDGIIAFDLQLETKLVLKAIWLVETQQWTEAYLADARVIALWKMVGRHVNFGGELGRFKLFDQPGGGVRALKDEPGFELDINPPLPPPTHTKHTPSTTTRPSDPQSTRRGAAGRPVMRHDHGGVLDGLLNQSPHQPLNGCTAVVASTVDSSHSPVELRRLFLTPFNGPFVAWIDLCIFPDTDLVSVSAVTIEPPVGDPSDAFKDRRPTTAPLVGGPLGSTIADMVVNRQEEDDSGDSDEDEGADDDDGDSGEEDGADDGDSDENLDGDIDGDGEGGSGDSDEEEGADEDDDDDDDSDEDGDGDGDGDGQQQEEEGEGVEREAKRRRLEHS